MVDLSGKNSDARPQDCTTMLLVGEEDLPGTGYRIKTAREQTSETLMLKHYLEVHPKQLPVGMQVRIFPGETALRSTTIREDRVVYVICTYMFQEQEYSFVCYHEKFGWVNSMWLEDV